MKDQQSAAALSSRAGRRKPSDFAQEFRVVEKLSYRLADPDTDT